MVSTSFQDLKVAAKYDASWTPDIKCNHKRRETATIDFKMTEKFGLLKYHFMSATEDVREWSTDGIDPRKIL